MKEIYKENNSMSFDKYITQIRNNEYNVYIVGDIVEDYTNYIDLHELLMKNNLKINIIIKSFGGDMSSSLALADMIKNSKSTTIAHIHTARSGGSIIALACDKMISYEFSTFMIHEPQFMYNRNNLSQVKSYVEFLDILWQRVLKYYQEFDENIILKLKKNKEVFYCGDSLKQYIINKNER